MCSVSGCSETVHCRGLCNKHYRRWLHHGDVNHISTRSKRVEGEDYIRLYEPEHPLAHRDGYVREHRHVAWAEGILTDPRDHVHHIDGNPKNNDVNNLEILTPSEHSARHNPVIYGCGTIQSYKRGCHCSECKAANTEHHRQYRAFRRK
jgi:hypothetical protein